MLLSWLVAIASVSPDSAGVPRAPAVAGTERLQRGILLVAGRNLQDPNFSRSVILVTHLDDSGTAGIVLNRPLPMPAAQALPPLANVKPDPGRLFLGGPVEVGSLQLLVRTEVDLGPGSRVLAEVQLVEQAPVLRDLAEGRIRASALRLYAGYAGWGPGQLESELLRGDWLLWAADAEAVFTAEPERLWPELVEQAGAEWVRAPLPGADVAAPAQYNPALAAGTELRHWPAGRATGYDCRSRSDARSHHDRVSDARGRGQLLTC